MLFLNEEMMQPTFFDPMPLVDFPMASPPMTLDFPIASPPMPPMLGGPHDFVGGSPDFRQGVSSSFPGRFEGRPRGPRNLHGRKEWNKNKDERWDQPEEWDGEWENEEYGKPGRKEEHHKNKEGKEGKKHDRKENKENFKQQEKGKKGCSKNKENNLEERRDGKKNHHGGKKHHGRKHCKGALFGGLLMTVWGALNAVFYFKNFTAFKARTLQIASLQAALPARKRTGKKGGSKKK